MKQTKPQTKKERELAYIREYLTDILFLVDNYPLKDKFSDEVLEQVAIDIHEIRNKLIDGIEE